MNRPKHQHWIPQFYLRHFATPESQGTDQPQVIIFSKDDGDGDESLTNVRNVCGKRYLYSPVGNDGQRVWDLEAKLGGLESTMSQIWHLMSEGFVDLGNESIRKGVSLFIATMHLRNPESRQLAERIHQDLVSIYELAPKKPDGSPDIESVMVSDKPVHLNTKGWEEYRFWGKNDHDHFFNKTIEAEAIRIAKILMAKRWSIIFSAEDAFITSDNPVVLQHQSRTVFGFVTPGLVVIFPIGPRRLLVIDDLGEEPPNQYYPLQPAAVGAINLGIWKAANRFMITGRPLPSVLAEIAEWADSQ